MILYELYVVKLCVLLLLELSFSDILIRCGNLFRGKGKWTGKWLKTTKNIKGINIERFRNCFNKTHKLKYWNNVIIHTCWWPHKIIGRYRHILMLKNVPSYFEGTDHAVISYIIKLINFLSLQVTRLKKLLDLIPNYHS